MAISRQRAYQIRMKNLGRCMTCGKPQALGYIGRCVEHAGKERVRQRKLYKRRPWQLGSPGRPPTLTLTQFTGDTWSDENSA